MLINNWGIYEKVPECTRFFWASEPDSLKNVLGDLGKETWAYFSRIMMFLLMCEFVGDHTSWSTMRLWKKKHPSNP